MKTLLSTLSVIAVALFAFVRPAAADVIMEHCGCWTESQWTAAAASRGAGSVGYLYDFASRQVRKFRNGGGVILGGGDSREPMAGGAPDVTWLIVEARYQQQFDDMLMVRDFFARPLSGIRIDYDLPSGAVNDRGAPVGTYNGYTIMNGSVYENNLRDYLAEQRQQILSVIPNAGVVDALTRLLQSLDKAITSGELLKVEITVKFPDGSEAVFIDDGDGRPVRKPNETRDRNNNTIAESAGSGAGMYDVDNRDYEAWFHHMQMMGVRFVNGYQTIFCTWDGQTLTCRVPHLIY